MLSHSESDFARVRLLFGCAAAAIGCRSTGGPNGGAPDGNTAADSALDGAGDSIGQPVQDGSTTDATLSPYAPFPSTDSARDAACELDSADLCLVASSLTGLRWELPCIPGPGTAVSCKCPLAPVQTATLSGTAGQSYDIGLRFRGIVEEKTYSNPGEGGAMGAQADGGTNADLFIAGGTPINDTFNIYRLDISDPMQTFFLNSGASGFDTVFLLDYAAVVRMKVGATVTLTADSIGGLENYNRGPDGGPVFVPDVPPAPYAYDGQFVQMDVQSVVPVP